MARYDDSVLDRLEKAVEDFERQTSVELVFVLAHRSGTYPDVPWKVGSLAALLTLGLFIFAPTSFSAIFLIFDVVLAFALGWLAGRFLPGLSRVLVSAERRRDQVLRSCHAAFSQRGVSLTAERTGLLIYVSWFERQVEILWDVGVERAVPAPEWNQALKSFAAAGVLDEFPAQVDSALAPLSHVLCRHLPPVDDNPDEIPNRPVVIE